MAYYMTWHTMKLCTSNTTHLFVSRTFLIPYGVYDTYTKLGISFQVVLINMKISVPYYTVKAKKVV